MDPVKMEKLQAMKRYNRSKNLLSSLVQYLLAILMFGLFLSSPLWLPYLCSSIRSFFIVSLPRLGSVVTRPKCVFVISNLIIVFLVGESKLSSSSPKFDIHEEYVSHSQSMRRLSEKSATIECSLVEEKKEEEEEVVEKEVINVEEKEVTKEEEVVKDESEELEEERDLEGVLVVDESKELEEEEVEEKGLPAEELNKRVEDFIAMVNMQRRLEARMVVCCG